MAFLLRLSNFVKTSIILVLVISLCNATIRNVKTKFIKKKLVTVSHTTLKISKIQCVDICSKERQTGECTLAGYNKTSQTCFLSADDPKNVLDTTDEMSGVFFYETEPTGMINIFLNIIILFVNKFAYKYILYLFKICVCYNLHREGIMEALVKQSDGLRKNFA